MCQHLLDFLQSNSLILTAPFDVSTSLFILQGRQGYRPSEGESQDLAPSVSNTVVFPLPDSSSELGQKHLEALLRQITGPTSRAQVQEAWARA